MQTLDLEGGYRLTVSEMSRRAQLEISTWFNNWMAGGGSNLEKLQSVTAISTQVILHSRIALHRDTEKLPDGTYTLADGTVLTLPLTEVCLNDLPASLVAWLIDAAGRENTLTLESFLAGMRVIQKRLTKTPAPPSGSGH